MKSKILSRVLSVAAAAAMMATMATSAFAISATGTTAKIMDGDSAIDSKSAAIGSSFVIDAAVYNAATNVTDDVENTTVTWDVTTTLTATVVANGSPSDATEYAEASAPLAAALVARAAQGEGALTYSDSTYASFAKVAGTDGRSIKVTPVAVPVATPATPATVLKYKVTVSGSSTYYDVTVKAETTPVVKVLATGKYKSETVGDTASVTLSIKDNRYVVGTGVLKNSGADTVFDVDALKIAPVTGITLDDGVVTEINIGSKTQVTYKLLQAIYEQEEPVIISNTAGFMFTLDGLNMSSFGSAAKDTNVMTLVASANKLSRTLRANIAEASKDYGADFSTAIAEDPDDRDYYPLDLSSIVIPDQIDSITVTFDPDDVFETSHGDLADFAADGELYMYLYDDGDFTLYKTLDVTGRRDQFVTFEMEAGDEGQYIITTTKLEKGAASSSSSTPSSSSSTPASSSTAPSSDIPNTGDANVVAIAVMMAVIALGGAAVVAKKATK